MNPQAQAPRWYRRLVLAFVVLSFAVLCGWLWYRATIPDNGIRIEELQADLEAGLPDGSTWEEAEAWFASHDITAGGTIDAKGRSSTTCMIAIVPNDTLFETAVIWIYLYFTDGRLSKRDISRFVYSL